MLSINLIIKNAACILMIQNHVARSICMLIKIDFRVVHVLRYHRGGGIAGH